jgi:hypothetical protein
MNTTPQPGLFDTRNLSESVEIPAPPALVPHEWPFPGMTPEDSARAAIAASDAYADMLAAVIQTQGGSALTSKQVLALVPKDWKDTCGKYAHGSLDVRRGKERGIEVKHVPHENGGFHFTHQAVEILEAVAP